VTKKRQLIIPIFIPHEGCPHQCVFCNQKEITGIGSTPSLVDVVETIKSYLATWKGGGRREVAFYGGSFTGLDGGVQKELLKTANDFVCNGSIDSIRVSTRPDYISQEHLALLKDYGVETIELGVQSMVDKVLRLSGRGHTSDDTVRAVRMIKRFGFKVGLQIMPGLPGGTVQTARYTVNRVVRLRPDFVRIYPTLVIEGTPLERMYNNGDYIPWPIESMADLCKGLVRLLEDARIPIIRIGLQPTAKLEGSIITGPYHPSFRQLIMGSGLHTCK
jgi:histone acetyltransferase (RNA polymerase elongator complex component)